jgi:hypothetical protein
VGLFPRVEATKNYHPCRHALARVHEEDLCVETDEKPETTAQKIQIVLHRGWILQGSVGYWLITGQDIKCLSDFAFDSDKFSRTSCTEGPGSLVFYVASDTNLGEKSYPVIRIIGRSWS